MTAAAPTAAACGPRAAAVTRAPLTDSEPEIFPKFTDAKQNDLPLKENIKIQFSV